VQVVVMNVTDRQESYVREVEAALRDAGFRVATDLRNEKITYKIREHSIQKLPYQLVLGDKEVAAKTVSARTRAGENLAPVPLDRRFRRVRLRPGTRLTVVITAAGTVGRTFTYAVTADHIPAVRPGTRVIVPFKNRREASLLLDCAQISRGAFACAYRDFAGILDQGVILA